MKLGLHVSSLSWFHCNQQRDIWADCFKILKNEIWRKMSMEITLLHMDRQTDRDITGSSASGRAGIIQ